MGWAKAQYIEYLHAQAEQERRKALMAVNPPGLLLKRLQQAKTVHGLTPNVTAPTQPVRMEKKVSATLPNGFSRGASSSGLGAPSDGYDAALGPRQKSDIEPDGCSKKDAAIMRRIRKGRQSFGVDDPWWVVHDKPQQSIARYHSEPSLIIHG